MKLGRALLLFCCLCFLYTQVSFAEATDPKTDKEHQKPGQTDQKKSEVKGARRIAPIEWNKELESLYPETEVVFHKNATDKVDTNSLAGQKEFLKAPSVVQTATKEFLEYFEKAKGLQFAFGCLNDDHHVVRSLYDYSAQRHDGKGTGCLSTWEIMRLLLKKTGGEHFRLTLHIEKPQDDQAEAPASYKYEIELSILDGSLKKAVKSFPKLATFSPGGNNSYSRFEINGSSFYRAFRESDEPDPSLHNLILQALRTEERAGWDAERKKVQKAIEEEKEREAQRKTRVDLENVFQRKNAKK